MAYELIKVSELPELTTPADANVVPIQDGDYLKRISFANLKEAASGDVADDLAAEYSASATYAIGDYCVKDGQLYRCTTAITTAEAWTSGHWTAVSLGADVSDLKNVLNATNDALNSVLFRETEVDFSNESSINQIISATTGKWGATNTARESFIINVPEENETITITANETNNTRYAFLTTNAHISNTLPDYVTGGALETLSAGETITLNKPVGCHYIYILKRSDSTIFTPASLTLSFIGTDVSLTRSGAAADAQATGDRLTSLEKAELSFTWEFGKGIDSEGGSLNGDNYARTSLIPITTPFYRGGALVDGDSVALNVNVCQYSGTTFISRTGFNVLDTAFAFAQNCTNYRIVIGYAAATGSTITQEIIDTYYKPYTLLTGTEVLNKLDELSTYHPSYSGRKLSILGDSISTFAATDEKIDGKAASGCTTNYPGNPVQYTNSDVTDVSLTWWGQVLDRLGMVLGINESWAGSTIGYNSSQTSSGKYTADNCLCSATRIGHLGENGTPDLIIVFGGTNDINHHRVGSGNTLRYDVGSLDTTNNPYDFANFPMITDTYYGSITTMLLRIQHSYPNATILMVLPYFCTYTHTSSGDIATPSDQNEWSNAAIDVCKFLGVDYLDLRTVINMYDVSSLLFDGLHPKANGMAMIAKAIIHKLNDML